MAKSLRSKDPALMHWWRKAIVQVMEEVFFPWTNHKWAFVPKTIHKWAFFPWTNHKRAFFSLVKQKRGYFPISVHCNLLHVSAAAVLGYLPTYQPTSFNFVLFAQNYLIKTLIDPIKLEHYPWMRRHFLIEPGDQGKNSAVQKTNLSNSKSEAEWVIKCEIYCKSFWVARCISHFSHWLLVIAIFQKHVP